MDNFYETAKRMNKSSQTLHNSGEYHNACYLAGYVVECYAKIIIYYGSNLNYAQLRTQFGHKLNDMNVKLLEYITQNSQYASYSRDLSIEFSNILNWSPFKRYSDSATEWNQTDSNKFQSEIPKAMQILTQMSLDTSSNLI